MVLHRNDVIKSVHRDILLISLMTSFVFQDPKRHLEEHVDVLMTSNIVQCLAAMLDTVVFK